MPAAIPLIFSQGTALFGWSALTTAVATITSTLAVGMYERQRAKQKARDAYNKSLQDRIVPIKSGVATRCYVLGQCRLSGPIMYVETVGPSKSMFDVVIAIANNECTLDGWYFNEDFVSTLSFPGAKYGTTIAVPTSDEFGTVTGTSATVTLSAVPRIDINPITAVWRKDGATGFATATKGAGANVNLTGLPVGVSSVSVSYSSNQADNLSAQFQEGADDQTASTWPGISTPLWTANHRLRGIANARALYAWDENLYQAGAPALGVLVTGRAKASHPFYDPRNGSNPSTTKNPAILAGWWMTLPRALGGCGIPSDWIDWQSIAAAANVCDEQVSLKNHDGSGYTTGPRYECHAILDTADAPAVNLETILSAMAGRKAFTGGLYKVVAGAFRPATLTLTDRDLVGTEPFRVGTGSEEAPKNIVTATFVDSRLDFLETPPQSVRNDDYVTEDGSEQILDITLPATNDARRANYLMGVALEGSRPVMTCQVTVGGVGENIAIYDTLLLSLTNRTAYTGITFEVIEIEEHWNGTFTLSLAEIRPQTWALDPDNYTPIDPATLPDTSYIWNPPHPAAFQVAAVTPQLLPDGTAVSRVELTWAAMPAEGNSPNAKIELRYRVAGGNWIGIAAVPGDSVGSVVTTALIDGEIYQFQARYVNGFGAASTWVDAFTQIEGTPLPAPLSMRLRATSTIFRVPQSGNALPVSITLEAVKTAGLTEDAVFETSPSVTLTGTGDSRTLTYANMGANESVQVTCTVSQGGIDYIDTVTILKVFDGADSDDTPDVTPPPTPAGLAVTSFTQNLLVTWTPAAYTEGHGHQATIVYAAAAPVGPPLPTFSAAQPVGDSAGNSFVFPAEPGSRWSIWIKFQSRDGILSLSPAGGTNGVQGTAAQIGTTNLGPLIVEAGNLANGAVTTAKIAAASLDATKFASSIQPIGIVTSVPSVLSTRTVFNTTDGKLYRWNGSAYVRSVDAQDISVALGQLTDAQIQSIATAKLTGTITSTQITDGAISTPKLAAGAVTTAALAADAVTADKIAANAVTASEIAAGAVIADKLAANSVIAGKIAAGAVSATEIAAGAITTSKLVVVGRGAALNDDPACVDQSAWSNYPGGLPGTFACNTPFSGAPGGTVMRITNALDVMSRQFPVVPGKRYRINAWARKVSGTGVAYVGVLMYTAGNSGGSYSSQYYIPEASGVGLPSTLTRYAGTFEVPANIAVAVVYLLGNYTGTGVTDFADVRLEEAIPAELIVDGAITARKLVIAGGGDALNPDPGTADLTAWTYQETGRFVVANVTDFAGATTVLRSTTSSAVPVCRPIAFNPSKTYRVRCRARSVGAGGVFYLLVDLKDSSGARIGGSGTFWLYPASGVTVPSGVTEYSGKFGAGTSNPFPSNARTMAVGAILNYQSTTGYHEVTDLLVEECVDAGIIVDGAIQAQHLSANSIAVGTAAIQNGAIVNAMIGNAAIDSAKILELQVEKLSSGTLGATINVGAGKITYDNGVIFRCQGTGFGTSNQFIDWYGPRPPGGNMALCDEASATYYLKTNGTAYFGGQLLAGTLRNAARSTDISPTASITIGPYATNGNQKLINVSYGFNGNKNVGGNPGTGTFPASCVVQLFQTIAPGSETLVATLTATGNRVVTQEDVSLWNDQCTISGSLTYTDSVGGTAQRTYRATIQTRSLGGGSYTAGQSEQTVSLSSTEQ
jgi:hypothetical protein